MTDLDVAFAQMQANPDDDAARLRYFERLADSELFVVLAGETDGVTITPELFDAEGHKFALAFDRPDRLASFAERAAPFVALSGRTLVQMLTPQNIGLAINLGAPSADLVPAEALGWLHEMIEQAPQTHESQIVQLRPPTTIPEPVLTGLDRKLATMIGRARQAWLVAADYGDGRTAPLLVFLDAAPGSEGALAAAVREALVFSGVEAGSLDVSFARSTDSFAARLAKHGLRFDLPQPAPAQQANLPAPGSDPTKPPILK